MDIVRDDSGRPLVPTERDGDDWWTVDVATGELRTVPAATVDAVTDEPPLSVAARALPRPTEPPLDSILDVRALGLLVLLDATGPRAVRSLLGIDGLCESDLHGAVGELAAAGLATETDVAGRRGYRVTDAARTALAALRD
jgi:hypothetical protein